MATCSDLGFIIGYMISADTIPAVRNNTNKLYMPHLEYFQRGHMLYAHKREEHADLRNQQKNFRVYMALCLKTANQCSDYGTEKTIDGLDPLREGLHGKTT